MGVWPIWYDKLMTCIARVEQSYRKILQNIRVTDTDRDDRGDRIGLLSKTVHELNFQIYLGLC